MARGSILGLLATLLAVVCADGIYTKNSPVLQVDAKSYDALIAQSNHTSVSPIP
jgi:protein disulfide-isomerase A6